MDAVWDGRLDGSRDEGLGIDPQKVVIFWTNVGHPIVTNGEFVALWSLPKSLGFLL